MSSPFQELYDLMDDFTDDGRIRGAVNSGLQSGCVVARTGVQQCFIDAKSPAGVPWPALTWPRLEGGTEPLRNTNSLMNSIEALASGMELTVQTNRRGAGLMNFGGTVVPVNVKFLTVPATLTAKRCGGARLFPGALHAIVFKDGQSGLLIDENGEIQYYLRKKTVIPQREFLGFSDETQETVLIIVADHVLKDGMGGKTP